MYVGTAGPGNTARLARRRPRRIPGMHVVAFVMGVAYAAAGVVCSVWNAADWARGRPPHGRYVVASTGQWAIAWACVLAMGLGLAAWAA
jgi:hypothetical protein